MGVTSFCQKSINPVVAEPGTLWVLLGMSSKLDHYKLYYIGFMTKNSRTQIYSQYLLPEHLDKCLYASTELPYWDSNIGL